LEAAHIVGKTPRSARGSEKLPHGVTLDSYENLIAMCPNDHHLIDDESPHDYPGSRLRAMKAAHESAIHQDHGARTTVSGRIETDAVDGVEAIGVDVLGSTPVEFTGGTTIRTRTSGVSTTVGLRIGSKE
jgi:hypothetical protein